MRAEQLIVGERYYWHGPTRTWAPSLFDGAIVTVVESEGGPRVEDQSGRKHAASARWLEPVRPEVHKSVETDPWYEFVIVAAIGIGLFAIFTGGLFDDPIGPSRIVIGGSLTIGGGIATATGLWRRHLGIFTGGLFFLMLGLLNLLGVPPCVSGPCGGGD